MSVAPPVPGHLHTLDLPTSGIDDEPQAGAHRCVSRERSAQIANNARSGGDEAAGLFHAQVYETSISLNSLCTSTPSRGSNTGTVPFLESIFRSMEPSPRQYNVAKKSEVVFPARLIQKYTRSSSSDVPRPRSTPCKLSKGSSHLVPAVRLPTWFESHRITFLCPH